MTPTDFNDVAFSGGALQVDVTTQAECTWSAVSNATWVTVSSGSTGTGSGSVQLSVAGNPGGGRSGTLVIAGKTVKVSQKGRPACAYTIDSTSYGPLSTGGTTSVSVTTIAGCDWTVSGYPAWVSASPTSGSGSGTTTISVQPNDGAARSATFKIATRDFDVQQASAPCTYTSGPTTRTVPYTQSTREIGVNTQAHCPVSATKNKSWIKILSAPKFGSGEIVIRMDENSSENSRTGTVTVTGENFTLVVTVIQEGRP